MSGEGLSWKEQLNQLRSRVVEMEKKRAEEKRLQRERNEESLRRRLKEDTPEALTRRFNEIRNRFDHAVRKFYPPPHLEPVIGEIGRFGDLMRFYQDCMKSFGKVFSEQHKTTIRRLLGELGTLQRGLDRQLRQWRAVQAVLDETTFRSRTPADDPALVAIAKSFSERAHKVPLSIPSDYFAKEDENFWVAERGGGILGYVKFWPGERVLTFAVEPPENVNFNKSIRGLLYKFCTAGPLGEPMSAVRVRITFVREVRFFTDMGFVRAETLGPSDWIYQRGLD